MADLNDVANEATATLDASAASAIEVNEAPLTTLQLALRKAAGVRLMIF